MREPPGASTILARTVGARRRDRSMRHRAFARILPCSASRPALHGLPSRPPRPVRRRNRTPRQIALGLRKLGVAGSVLYVAAHPDDENTRAARLPGQRRAGAHGLPVAHARRRRAEPGRRRSRGRRWGSSARRSCWPRAASTAPSSSSPARATSGSRRAPRRRCASGARTPCWPTSCAVIRRFRPDVIITRFSPEPARRTATTRRRRCWRWRPSAPRPIRSSTPSSSPAASRPGRRGGCCGTESSSSSSRPRPQRRRQAGRRRLQPAARRCRTASSPPTAAACTRARGSASPAAAAPIVEYFQLLARPSRGEAEKPLDGDLRRHRLASGASRGRRAARLVDEGRRQASTPRRPRLRSRPARRRRARSAQMPDAAWRPEAARGARPVLPPARDCSSTRRRPTSRAAPGQLERRPRPPSIARRRR